MPIFDSQVHAYDVTTRAVPGSARYRGRPRSPATRWWRRWTSRGRRRDAGLAVQHVPLRRELRPRCLRQHPTRFRLVKPVDPTDPGVTNTIADWAATKGTIGIRVFLRDTASTDPADPAINHVLAEAGRHSLPVNLACTGRLEQAGQLAARNPDTQLVIDHLGLHSRPPAGAAEPFGDLPRCWRWPPTRTSRSRSAAPAPCRTSPSPTKTSGIPSAASSTPFASVAACGAPTGPARSRC